VPLGLTKLRLKNGDKKGYFCKNEFPEKCLFRSHIIIVSCSRNRVMHFPNKTNPIPGSSAGLQIFNATAFQWTVSTEWFDYLQLQIAVGYQYPIVGRLYLCISICSLPFCSNAACSARLENVWIYFLSLHSVSDIQGYLRVLDESLTQIQMQTQLQLQLQLPEGASANQITTQPRKSTAKCFN